MTDFVPWSEKKPPITWVEAGSDYVTLQQPRTPFDPCFSAISTRIKSTEPQSPSWTPGHSGVCTSSRLGAPHYLNSFNSSFFLCRKLPSPTTCPGTAPQAVTCGTHEVNLPCGSHLPLKHIPSTNGILLGTSLWRKEFVSAWTFFSSKSIQGSVLD